MISTVRAGANVILKIQPDGGNEKTIGFVTSISLQVAQGTKPLYAVDSPFPQEIVAGGVASQVGIQMSVLLLKGTALESIGLISDRNSTDLGETGTVGIAASKYVHIRLYDRESGEMFYGVEFCKANSFNIVSQTRTIVRADISFSGMYLVSGNG